MIFQCSDLDRALEHLELMPDARAHAAECERCRYQLYLWREISRVAPELHEEWDSPELWPQIAEGLAAEAPRRRGAPVWRWMIAAAAVALVAVALSQPWHVRRPAPAGALLTEEALAEVQRAEAAYAGSIARLSAIAAKDLEKSPAPLAAPYREKMLVLDSAIAEVKANLEHNRYNAYLQTELAALYKDKQNTLKEWLDYAKSN